MMFSPKVRHLLVSIAIIVASVIQLARGYARVVVVVGAVTFLVAGNAMVWLSGTKERAERLRRKRAYYEGEL